MLKQIDKKTKVIEILRNYTGKNTYILKLQRDVIQWQNVKQLTDFNVEYVLKNHDVEPKVINRSVSLTEWYSEKMKEKWQCEFFPEKVLIKEYLGETDTYFHCVIKFRKNMEPMQAFLSKKGVVGNFLLEDFNDLEVDFDRYDNLSNVRRPDKPRKIMEHQKEAIKFLLSRKKCILALDMGLGKSLALSVAAFEGNFDSIIVVCPSSLKSNWFDELSYYFDERDISIIGGVNDMKKSELEQYLGYGVGKSGKTVAELQAEAKERGKWTNNRVVIINFDILNDVYQVPSKKADVEKAFENSPMLQYIYGKKSLIIIDEAHRLSQNTSKQYKVVSDLIKRGNPDSVFLATGTPITNNPMNYYHLLKLIGDPITEDYNFYVDRYCKAFKMPINAYEKQKKVKISGEFVKKKGKKSWYDLTDEEKKELNELIDKKVRQRKIPNGSDHLEELRDKTAHIYLRRTKDDLGGLPTKSYHERIFELDAVQLMEYERLWEEYEALKKEENPNQELSKELLEGGLYRKYLSNQMVPNTIELVDRCIAKDEKVIIACCYDEELYTLRDYYGDKCVIYNGKMSTKEKDAAKDKFMTDPSVMVFIGNIDSAGVGLTLTASRVLVFNNISYVPGVNKQMEDRIYRIGQKRDVHIYYQFFKDTQYEKMWNTVLRKSLVINQIIKKEDEK